MRRPVYLAILAALFMTVVATAAQAQRVPPAGYVDPVAGAAFMPPPRPSAYQGISDGDLFATLQGRVLADQVDAMNEGEYWWWRYISRFANIERDAGRTTWIQRNPPTGYVAPAPAAAPLAARPSHCLADGACYFALVAHHGDVRDANQRSYDGTSLGWGIRLSDRASPGLSVAFTICGMQLYGSPANERDIRGRLNPTSEAYVRRFSLYPYESWPAICSWAPPRYTGPNR